VPEPTARPQRCSGKGGKPETAARSKSFSRCLGLGQRFSEVKMPYALFCEDAKISRAYPTEADVWKHAAENGLVVDVASEGNHPKRILDNGYTIRPCQRDPIEKHVRGATDLKLTLGS
jgi:hypothetical protein